MKPQVELLSTEYEERVTFCVMAAGSNREFLIKLDISGFPSFLFYKNGRKNSFLAGSNTWIEEIREHIEMLLV